MKLNRLFGACLLAGLVACGGDDPQEEGLVANDPTTEKVDVSAALKNIFEQSASYQVSLTVGRDVTRVELAIRPGDDTELNGEPVKVSETVNQTTQPNGFVTETKTTSQWDTDPDSQDRIRIRRVDSVSPTDTLFTEVLSNAKLPDPVQVDTTGSFYDGAIYRGTVRLGLVEVRWAVEPNNADTAWVCMVGSNTLNTTVSKECYLVNPAGELQGNYRSEQDNGQVRVVFL